MFMHVEYFFLVNNSPDMSNTCKIIFTLFCFHCDVWQSKFILRATRGGNAFILTNVGARDMEGHLTMLSY